MTLHENVVYAKEYLSKTRNDFIFTSCQGLHGGVARKAWISQWLKENETLRTTNPEQAWINEAHDTNYDLNVKPYHGTSYEAVVEAGVGCFRRVDSYCCCHYYPEQCKIHGDVKC